jgi:anti-sigma factor RsiW
MSNTCTDIQATLSTYLDAELDNADLREFESHVGDCDDCQSLIESAERSHSALRAHLQETPKASDLFRKRLANALDQEDKGSQRERRRDWIFWSMPAAASALAVAALALFIWTDLSPQPEVTTVQSSLVTQDAARQHLQEKPLIIGNDRSTMGRSATDYLRQPVQAPRFASTEVQLKGWSPAQLAGKPVATFVYEVTDRKGLHRVNVHVVKRGELDLSSHRKLKIGGAELSVASALGFTTVTYAGSGPLAYVFSSDMTAESLMYLVTNTDIVNTISQRPAR